MIQGERSVVQLRPYWMPACSSITSSRILRGRRRRDSRGAGEALGNRSVILDEAMAHVSNRRR